MTNLQFQTKLPTAHIAVNKNVQSEFYGQVFLNSEEEFQIELFNPLPNTVAAKIYLNDNLISSSMLVIKPGERVWLERFLDTNKKFKLATYSVDNTPLAIEAIKSNGKVRIEFFREKEVQYLSTYNYIYHDWNPPTTPYINPAPNSNPWYSDLMPSYTCEAQNINCYNTSMSNTIETGRVEKGSNSNQDFSSYYGDFEYFSFHNINLQLLPLSAKTFIDSRELNKVYCPSCGKKAKKGDNFCRKCGTKI